MPSRLSSYLLNLGPVDLGHPAPHTHPHVANAHTGFIGKDADMTGVTDKDEVCACLPGTVEDTKPRTVRTPDENQKARAQYFVDHEEEANDAVRGEFDAFEAQKKAADYAYADLRHSSARLRNAKLQLRSFKEQMEENYNLSCKPYLTNNNKACQASYNKMKNWFRAEEQRTAPQGYAGASTPLSAGERDFLVAAD
eukprot:GEMP01087224.1.p1 GENE.GEMP01087224.1~~GEMP01087224.1.p1  ORF type:complete len:196 (+),score=58.21 GEMP01087224.1:91-678(+)